MCTLVCPGHMHFSQLCTHERCKGYWALRFDDGACGAVSLRGLRALIAFDCPQRMIGAFQFAPLKRACLMHCRNPLTYFLTRWRDGASGGFRMGFNHGLFCVACCWALMATTLAVGVMSLWWMAALAVVTFAEQVSPWGDRVRIGVGVALIIRGVTF